MGYSSYMEIQHFRIFCNIQYTYHIGMPSRWRQNNVIFFGEDYSAASDCHNVRKGRNGNEIYLKQRDLCGYRKWGERNQITLSLAIQTESTERQTDGCAIPVAAYNKTVEIKQMFLSQRTWQHINCSDTNCTQVSLLQPSAVLKGTMIIQQVCDSSLLVVPYWNWL